MKILHLNLYRKYFDEILNGTKTIEYRDIKPYWTKRLENRHYDIIIFRNGYKKLAPEMIVEYNGLDILDRKYAIKLGKILEYKNCEKK